MTKAAIKEREPALDLGMKDVTPKKGDDTKFPKPTAPKGRKRRTSTDLATIIPAVPANLDTPQDFLALITRALSLSKGDVSNIRELLAMKDEQLTKIRAQEYNVAFHTARGRMPPIVKDGTAPNFKYPTLENVSTQIDGIARECGFTHRFGTADSIIPGHYRVVCDLSHVNGYSERHFLDLPADGVGQKGNMNKSPVQAVNSTISTGRRHLKIIIWDLVIVGSDKDGNKAKGTKDVGMIDAKRAATLKSALEFAGVTEKHFCGVYEIEKIEDLKADLFEHALKDCQNVRAEKDKGK